MLKQYDLEDRTLSFALQEGLECLLENCLEQ